MLLNSSWMFKRFPCLNQNKYCLRCFEAVESVTPTTTQRPTSIFGKAQKRVTIAGRRERPGGAPAIVLECRKEKVA